MLPYAVRNEIFRLYNQEELEPAEILERIEEKYPDIEVTLRTIYRHIKKQPAPRQSMPPSSHIRVQLPPSYSIPALPAPAQQEPIEAEYWVEIPESKRLTAAPKTRKQKQKREFHHHPETGQFISREEYESITHHSQALVRYKKGQALEVHRPFDPYDVRYQSALSGGLIRSIGNLFKMLLSMLFGNSAPANNQRLLTTGNQSNQIAPIGFYTENQIARPGLYSPLGGLNYPGLDN